MSLEKWRSNRGKSKSLGEKSLTAVYKFSFLPDPGRRSAPRRPSASAAWASITAAASAPPAVASKGDCVRLSAWELGRPPHSRSAGPR